MITVSGPAKDQTFYYVDKS